MKNRLGWLVILVSSAVAFSLASGQARQTPTEINFQQPGTDKFVTHGARALPNRYIVVLDQDAPGPRGRIADAAAQASAVLQSLGRTASYVYGHAISGFA